MRVIGGRGRVLLRRAGFYLATAWVAITVNFLVPRIMPGDPASVILDKLATKQAVTPATEEAMRALFGLPGGSLWQQYLDYLGQLSRGDLGVSTSFYPLPVSEVIAQGLPWTVALVGITTVLAFVIGTTLGAISGRRPGGPLDNVLAPLAAVLGSMPYFWVATLLVLVFAIQLPIFPGQNGADLNAVPGWNAEFVVSAVQHAVLPALAIIVSTVGGWLLGMRNMMVTTVSEDYVLLAEAKGLSRGRVLLSYAARNAMLPQVAQLSISLGAVVGGSMLAEVVFSYPGVGFLFYQAVADLDYALMQALFLTISLSVLLANFVADSVYVLLDPRTKED